MIPIGNETLGLVEGVLSALMFAGAWAVMRIAGVSRLLAAGAMLVAVIALVYGLQYPIGGLLQHGAIRFGLPIGVVVGAVAESRWPGAATPARLLQLLTVGIASIWALEAFAYTALTVARSGRDDRLHGPRRLPPPESSCAGPGSCSPPVWSCTCCSPRRR